MAQTAEAASGTVRERAPARPRSRWIDDFVTAVLSGWVVTGMVLDAWAHQNASRLETFFTPWHGVLYSGFAAVAAWMVARALAGGRSRPLRARVPVGYGLGLAGVAAFLVSGVGDGIWHTFFGVERNLEAALSPTHIGLFLGALLIFTTPLRAAWSSDRLGPAPGLRELLPALLGLTFTTVLVTFLFYYLSAFRDPQAIGALLGVVAGSQAVVPFARELGVAAVQATNLLLLAPVLLLLRRWRPPFGSATLLFATVAFCTAATEEFAFGEVVLAALVGGLLADWLIARTARGPDRTRAIRLVAAAVPLGLWGAYFLVLQVRHGITWPAELWTGSVVFACLGAFTLSLLMVPPARPAGEEPEAGRR
ncbi:MAG TPA: hypothetical protein VGM21_07235 [Actinomycetota bacterium]|jgi:hypothetical protein